MYAKNNSNIPPLLPNIPPVSRPNIQPLLPSNNNNYVKPIKFNIKRFDHIHRDTVIDTLINSLEQSTQQLPPNKDTNDNLIEIQTTDFKHGLYPSTSSSASIELWKKKSSEEVITLVKSPLPSLLSLKVNQPKNLIHDNGDSKTAEFNMNQFETSNHPVTNPIVAINDILHRPKRDRRPAKMVIILRGLPGSGKSYLTNLIKSEEEKWSNEKPKVFSIDNYFITEQEETVSNLKKAKKIITTQTVMKYEYDPCLDETYQRSLIKSFKKTIDDNLFNFLIVDMVNQKVAKINEMYLYANTHGFYTFVVDLSKTSSVKECFDRNVHGRSIHDIGVIENEWEELPNNYTKLDVSYFSKFDEIENVEMEDVVETISDQIKAEVITDDELQPITFKSKWDDKLSKEEVDNGHMKIGRIIHQEASSLLPVEIL